MRTEFYRCRLFNLCLARIIHCRFYRAEEVWKDIVSLQWNFSCGLSCWRLSSHRCISPGDCIFLPWKSAVFLRFLSFIHVSSFSSTPGILTLMNRKGLSNEDVGTPLLEEISLHIIRYNVFIRPLGCHQTNFYSSIAESFLSVFRTSTQFELVLISGKAGRRRR